MHEAIIEHVDEIEEEWDRPIGERLLKIAVLAIATFGANILLEMAYDKIRDRRDEARIINTTATIEE